MDSTRSIRIFLPDPFDEICGHNNSRMLNNCAISFHDGCWKYLPFIQHVEWASNGVISEVVLDGGGRFSPAGIVGVHTLSILLSSQAAHDRAAVDSHIQDKRQTRTKLTRG